jgi:hypothetical protein
VISAWLKTKKNNPFSLFYLRFLSARYFGQNFVEAGHHLNKLKMWHNAIS